MQSLPSFSLVLETENLANANIEDLSNSLASLVKQSISPTQANEVLLLESGDVPPQRLKQLCNKYPWIKVKSVPLGTSYYKAKMLGAEIATGDVLVYCDSDCIYERNWLETILTTFKQNQEIKVVAGETTTRGKGPYGTAMALAYIFPQYSDRKELTSTKQYFLNNVAFNREFLLEYPIPTELPLYRGNCAIHAYDLLNSGHTIWQQPQARSTHAPPEGLSHFFWRFLLIGHDYYWQKRLLSPRKISLSKDDPMSGIGGKWQVFYQRVGKMFVHNPLHLLYFPFALPIIFASVGLIFIGYVITTIKPNFLLEVYD